MKKVNIMALMSIFFMGCVSTSPTTMEITATDAEWERAIDSIASKPLAPWSRINKNPENPSCSYQTTLFYKGSHISPVSCKANHNNGDLHCTWRLKLGDRQITEKWILDRRGFCKWKKEKGNN